MKKLQKKKGFTLTELAIVIAVIAILIAVLVPTFVSLINSANDSVDKQTAKNLNTALSVDEAENGKPAALCGVWAVLEEYGYNPAPDPNYSANTFYWYKAENRIVVVSENKVTFPEEYEGIEIVAVTSGAVGIALAETSTATQLTDYSDVYYLGIDENSAYAHAGSFSSYGDECSVCHKKYSTTESFATILGTLSATNSITLVDDLSYTINTDDKSTKSNPAYYASIVFSAGGTLDLGGNTISISSASGKNGIYTGTNYVTLRNGTVTMDYSASSTYGVINCYKYLSAVGNLTLENMTVELTGTGYCVNIGSGDTTTGLYPSCYINDTTIISNANNTTTTYSLYVGSNATATITGNSKIKGIMCVSATSTVTIEDGDFTECTFNCINAVSSPKPITVSGGTFSEDLSANSLITIADGYECKSNGDGTYSVVVVDTSAT